MLAPCEKLGTPILHLHYDCLGRRVTTTFPSGSGNHMIVEYDLLGLATKTIDLNGIATYNYYDERGRLTKATYPEIGDVKYFYDATGLKTKVTDALSHSTEYFFDYSILQLTKTQDALGKVLRYYYDGINRVTKTGAGSTADIMPTYNYYDAATGQMTKVTYTDAARGQARTRAFRKVSCPSRLTRCHPMAVLPATCVPVPTGVGNTGLTMQREVLRRQSGHTRALYFTRNGSNSLSLTSRCLPRPVAAVRGYVPASQPTKTTNPNGPSSKQSSFMQCNLPGKNSVKLNPYGLVETFGYDSRNRLTTPQRDCPAPVAATCSARRVSIPVTGLVERGGDVRGCPDRFGRAPWTSGTATDVNANGCRAGQRPGVMRSLLPAHSGPCQSPQGAADSPSWY